MKGIRKKKTVIQTLIDLTPLLDVIFLVLIVSLMEQASLADKMRETEATNYDVINNGILQDMKETYEEINEYVNVVSVYAGYQSETNRTQRSVYVQINTADNMKIFELKKGDEGNTWKSVSSYIEEQCMSDKDKHLILTVSGSRNEYMLYRDEKSIKDMFFDIADRYPNVSIQTNKESGE